MVQIAQSVADDIRQTQEVPVSVLTDVFKKHRKYVPYFVEQEKQYEGEHDILQRQPSKKGRSNAKVVANCQRYIVDMNTAILTTDEIEYTTTDEMQARLDAVKDILAECDAMLQDIETVRYCAEFGCSYELLYKSSKTLQTKIKSIKPYNAFVVYDDSLDEEPAFGVYYYRIDDAYADDYGKYIVYVFVDKTFKRYISSDFVAFSGGEEEMWHGFAVMPLIKYVNNSQEVSDFYYVRSLIDNYEILLSEIVNNIINHNRNKLFIKGGTVRQKRTTPRDYEVSQGNKIGADKDEDDDITKADVINMQADSADAKFLQNDLDLNGIRDTIDIFRDEIAKFSYTPNLTDKNFIGNSSGVSLAYKTLAFINNAKVKERYIRKGLKQRLYIICNALNSTNDIDIAKIKITFCHTLPKDLKETADIVYTLKGTVPLKTLLTQIPFIDNVDECLEELKKEQKEQLEKEANALYPELMSGGVEDDEAADNPDAAATNKKREPTNN